MIRRLIEQHPPDQPAHWIDPRGAPVYALLGTAAFLEVAVLWLTNFSLGDSSLLRQLAPLMLLLGLSCVVRRVRYFRLADVLQAVSILSVAAALAVVGSIFLASVSLPFIDPALAAMDQALGFDFPALVRFYQQTPWFAAASHWAYASLAIQSAIVPTVLALHDTERFWRFINVWVFVLAVAVILLPLAPAAGPFATYGLEQQEIPNFLFPGGTGRIIDGLRDGSIREISQAARGLVSIPSFHAAAAVMFAWSTWPLRWARWLMVLLNLAMIGSTIVTGAHYLIDVLAGAAVAAIAIALSHAGFRTKVAAAQDQGALEPMLPHAAGSKDPLTQSSFIPTPSAQSADSAATSVRNLFVAELRSEG